LRVVRRVFEEGAYADRAFNGEASALGPRERGLAMALAYGTIQRRFTLDWFAARLSSRPLERLEPAVLAGLRLGLFQLMYLDGVADHAAVNETVSLVKRASRGGAGLVNAVLRRAAAEREALLGSLHDDTPQAAAVMHSVPVWLAELWWEELGAAEARALLAVVNRPAESALRVNTLAASVADVVAALPVRAHGAPDLPEGLVLEAPFDAHGSELWREGAIMPQSRGSMRVARVLAPAAGERVLDLCAAPGGKTTHLAALMEDQGSILAIERHDGRARALAATCTRMYARCIRVEQADAAAPRSDAPFDRVLIDPPCSGLGTLQSRPDLRWRVTPAAIDELTELQARILHAGATATRPGGTLVYSVCTISRREGPALIDRFLERCGGFVVEDTQQLLPHRDGTDGFFIARLRRPSRPAPPRRPRHRAAGASASAAEFSTVPGA
jgi:16S rRNA (cytosine967-C5)-methyltransferase